MVYIDRIYISGDGLTNLENDEEFSKEVEKVELAPKKNKRCLRFQFLQKVGEIGIVHNILLGMLARYTVIKVCSYFWTRIISHKIKKLKMTHRSDSVTNQFDFCLGNTSRY